MSIASDNAVKQLLGAVKELNAHMAELEARIYIIEVRVNSQNTTPPLIPPPEKRGPGRPRKFPN